MSRDSGRGNLWNILVDSCVPIMNMIDWTHSHPDNINSFCLAYGIDAGLMCFLNVRLPSPCLVFNSICWACNKIQQTDKMPLLFEMQDLESAISDTNKNILPEHLLLLANSLSYTGEFVGLNAKGLSKQRGNPSASSPFMQACFSVSFKSPLLQICSCIYPCIRIFLGVQIYTFVNTLI